MFYNRFFDIGFADQLSFHYFLEIVFLVKDKCLESYLDIASAEQSVEHESK